MATLILNGSVGSGSSRRRLPHNQPGDVTKVVARFVSLGFTWVSGVTSGKDRKLVRVIRLFQSIYKGSGKLDKGDGRIDLKGLTHKWLAADNAAHWVNIFGQSGNGWSNTADFHDSNGGYCTNWLKDAIINAGSVYYQTQQIPPMWVRECSPSQGGRAAGHGSHQTGIDVDMRLPLVSPHQNQWTFLGHRGYRDQRYDRDSAREQLTSIRDNMNAKLVFFNDTKLIRERLCRTWPNHQHHFHIRIRPPRTPLNYTIEAPVTSQYSSHYNNTSVSGVYQ